MINVNTFLCKPLNFKGICKVYPPTVNEVIDNDEYKSWISLLCITQDDLRDEYGKAEQEGNTLYIPTPLEYLLVNAYHSDEMYQLIVRGIEFFIHENVTILPDAKMIVIGNLEEELSKLEKLNFNEEKIEDHLRIINEDNYFDFQNTIRESIGQKIESAPEDWSNLHPKVLQFKLKARERDRVKAKQNAKNAPTLSTSLASICCMGIGLNPLNIGEISYASIQTLISTYQKHEKYEADCRSLMMGADPKKIGFKYWIRNEDD